MLAHQHRAALVAAGDALCDQHGGPARHVQEFGVLVGHQLGADGLGRATEANRQLLQERGALHVVTTERRSERFRAPHGDPAERLTVSQVQSPHLEHAATAQDGPHTIRRAHEAEGQDATFRTDPGVGQLRLERVEPRQVLTQRLAGDEPSESLAALQQAFGSQHLEGPAHRHPAGLVLFGQVRFRGQHTSGCELGTRQPATQVVGDRLVADGPHELVVYLYYHHCRR